MGLAICRRFIEAHGGRIEARNHEAGGATFSFSLPAIIEPARGVAGVLVGGLTSDWRAKVN
jgi:K+-sensing histidine kinase KdpD